MSIFQQGVESMRVVMFLGFWSLTTIVIAAGSVSSETDGSPTKTEFGDLVELGGSFQIQSESGELLQFKREPVLNWVNPTRNAGQKGCVFLWCIEGRPQVIGSIFTYGNSSKIRLRHEMHSLASRPLSAAYEDRDVWNPSVPGVEWTEFNKVASPNEKKRLRLTQMRVIARRFEATLEKPNGTKSRLELKPTPLYRYSSPKAGVLDGAVFSFSLGTDPEVLMLVEAAEDVETAEGKSGSPTWRYAFARFHYWKVFVENERGEVVWSADKNLRLVTNTIDQAWARERPYISYMADQQDVAP